MCVVALIFAIALPTMAAPIEERLTVCFTCHGENGQSQTPLTPSLGGQPAFYVLTQLFLFRAGRLDNPAMAAIAKTLSDDDLRSLSDAVAKLPPPRPPATNPEPKRFARGESLARQHFCNACHNPDFAGGTQTPRLANQREDYLVKTLRDFKSGKRIGYTAAMSEALTGVNDNDLLDIAHYLAHLPAAPGTGTKPGGER